MVSLTRRLQERVSTGIIWGLGLLVPLLTVAIIAGLALRSAPIFAGRSLADLLTTSSWRPLAGEFGFRAFLLGTIWVTVAAMVIATPICLLSALYLAEYMRPRARALVLPVIDLLAGIPSVVYGLFGVLVIVPLVKDQIGPWAQRHLWWCPWLTPQENNTGYGILAGALVLALMVAPFIISVADAVLRTVPPGMREASLSLGATAWETSKYVSLRKAFPGLVAAVVLGFSRAVGETMAVLMVVGNVAQVPVSIFDRAYPLPALIANNYGEMMSIPLYDAALLFAALVLLVVVLVFNLAAQLVLMAARRMAS